MDIDFGINQALVEELFLRYQENPSLVDETWRRYFDRMVASEPSAPLSNGNGNGYGNGGSNGHASYATPAPTAAPVAERAGAERDLADAEQSKVSALLNAFRGRGHLFARIDPLGLESFPPIELTPETFGLTAADLDKDFSTGDLTGPARLTLRELIARLEETYCRAIGVEFLHMESREERLWLQERMEASLNRMVLSPATQLRILTKLTDAEIFEQFLHTNFLGAKRFSGEGSESIIPLLDLLIEQGASQGVQEFVVGMAHRARLNVLVNIMGKPARDLFAGFADAHPDDYIGRGDVKYHMGYSHDHHTASGKTVHLSLAFNPSHLEFVNPVVEGRVRAKQDRLGDAERKLVMPVVLHGDGAFMGQGVVPETLNMAGLEGYSTGGTIHVVINNQVAFTTNPEDTRSTRYATDIMRILKAPVFHVNGEDPEAVAQVVQLAVAYRQAFAKDVCIDLYGYRKYGHNENDEPRFTQPVMYGTIDKKPTVRQVYVKHLVALGSINEQQATDLARARKDALEKDLAEVKATKPHTSVSAFAGLWQRYRNTPDAQTPDVETGVPQERLVHLLERMVQMPEGFAPHEKVLGVWTERLERARGTKPVEYASGEIFALATLVADGVRVRLSGQDVRRGTFTSRHAVLTDTRTGKRFSPFASVAQGRGTFDAFDSPLSEQGVLGFDYGYSLDFPDGLVLWEAQFGDFANGAQVIIDQFISAAEDKWNRLSGIVLQLPHGFEGQGPEHSSARLERFLQLCGEDNMFVCYVTTAAQLFHLLRRQVVRPIRRPLVMMTPKGMLRRYPSPIADFTHGTFRRVLPDSGVVQQGDKSVAIDPAAVRRVLLCTGKLYYELEEQRAKLGATDVAIVRVEQLYPLSQSELTEALAPYKPGTPVYWVQEEPWNMGAWYYLAARLPRLLGERHPLQCVARDESASPATGSLAAHKLEQARLLDAAFAGR